MTMQLTVSPYTKASSPVKDLPRENDWRCFLAHLLGSTLCKIVQILYTTGKGSETPSLCLRCQTAIDSVSKNTAGSGSDIHGCHLATEDSVFTAAGTSVDTYIASAGAQVWLCVSKY